MEEFIKVFTRNEMIEMIYNANSIDEVAELRGIMESDEFGVESALEMSCLLSEKEEIYCL